MGQSYLFVILLALTVATAAAVLMQVVFGLLEVKKRNHMTILMNAVVENDPAAVAILDFITGLLGKTAAVGQ